MSEEKELAAALTDALRVMLSDIEPSPGLRNWVRTELRSTPVEPKAKRRRSGRKILAIFTPSAAAVAVVIALVLGTDAAATFAVVRLPGGMVRITLGQIQGVKGANAKLRELGIRSIVVIPVRPGCKSHLQIGYIGIGQHRNSAAISIAPAGIPAGQTDVIAAKQVSPQILELGVTRIHGPAPPCVRSMKPVVTHPD